MRLPHLGLKSKIVLINLAIILLLAIAFGIAAVMVMAKALDRLYAGDINSRARSVESSLAHQEVEMKHVARLLTLRPDIIALVSKRDEAALKNWAKQQRDSAGVDTLTIIDAKGVVLARGHADKAGDSIANQPGVRLASEGKINSGFERSTDVRLGIQAGAPIKKDGAVIGIITCAVDLTRGHKFVDEIKKLYEIECTLFEGDTRISTTIMREGQRAIGTKMDNPKVIAAVLEGNGTFFARNRILNEDYETGYWPFRDPSGKVIGMGFIGMPRSIVLTAYRDLMIALGTIMLAVGAGAFVISFLFSHRLAKRLQHLATDLLNNSHELFVSSGHVSNASNALAGSSQSQAASLQEASASLEEMTSMTRRTGEHTETAKNLAQQAREVAEQGATEMRDMVKAMNAIKESSHDIGKIIATIDQIAFQTNILALNAAVEAARAG